MKQCVAFIPKPLFLHLKMPSFPQKNRNHSKLYV